MGYINFTNCTLFIFFLYSFFTVKSFYEIFYPPTCQSIDQSNCLYSFPNWQNDFSLAICITSSKKKLLSSSSECNQFLKLSEFNLKNSFSKDFKIDLPVKTQKNGSLSAFLILSQKKNFQSDLSFQLTRSTHTVIKKLELSKYKQNSSEKYVNLLESKKAKEGMKFSNKNEEKKILTHLLNKVSIYTMDSQIDFDRYQIPEELYPDISIVENTRYLPYIHICQLSMKEENYRVLNISQTRFTLTIDHSPSSIGKLRFFRQLESSLSQMKELGFSDTQLNELTGMFTDTDLYIIFLTFVVSIFHLLFEFLAFRNDINFWRRRKTTVGLSLKTLAWRSISQIIIFFYLYIEKSSAIILVPSGISILIELWKMFKAFKVKVEYQSLFKLPKLTFGECSDAEKETNNYDSIAMKKLSYVLYPLCLAGAVYSLMYNTHKNWYSWAINSLVNAVYAFGFLFMTPQLFLNYKLKSVAHLPWKAFMYKAFNTFIDDVFAFIIKMPTMHRIACLRDDLIFVVYLYQRWLYPIDKTRVNEFGETFDEAEENSDSNKLKEE